MRLEAQEQRDGTARQLSEELERSRQRYQQQLATNRAQLAELTAKYQTVKETYSGSRASVPQDPSVV
jgi:hypothetical protein